MRRRFSMQFSQRVAYDMVRCHGCRRIWFTGKHPDTVACPDCGDPSWFSITDTCQECGGFSKLRSVPLWRECVECKHLQRVDFVPPDVSGHSRSGTSIRNAPGKIIAKTSNGMDIGEAVCVDTLTGGVRRATPSDTIIGRSLTCALAGNMVTVVMDATESPTGDSEP